MLIDVQGSGPLSAAGAGNCFHPPPNMERHSEGRRTWFQQERSVNSSKSISRNVLHLSWQELDIYAGEDQAVGSDELNGAGLSFHSHFFFFFLNLLGSTPSGEEKKFSRYLGFNLFQLKT